MSNNEVVRGAHVVDTTTGEVLRLANDRDKFGVDLFDHFHRTSEASSRPAYAQPDCTEVSSLLHALQLSEQRRIELLDQIRDLEQQIAEKRVAFQNKFAAAQAEFGALVNDKAKTALTRKGTSFDMQYSSLNAINDAVIGPLNRHGIGVRQVVCDHPTNPNLSQLQTIFTYDGYEEKFSLSLDSPAAHTARQNELSDFGGSVTRLRRYTLQSACSLAPADHPENGKRRRQNRESQSACLLDLQSDDRRVKFQEHPRLSEAKSTMELVRVMNSFAAHERGVFQQHFAYCSKKFSGQSPKSV